GDVDDGVGDRGVVGGVRPAGGTRAGRVAEGPVPPRRAAPGVRRGGRHRRRVGRRLVVAGLRFPLGDRAGLRAGGRAGRVAGGRRGAGRGGHLGFGRITRPAAPPAAGKSAG